MSSSLWAPGQLVRLKSDEGAGLFIIQSVDRFSGACLQSLDRSLQRTYSLRGELGFERLYLQVGDLVKLRSSNGSFSKVVEIHYDQGALGQGFNEVGEKFLESQVVDVKLGKNFESLIERAEIGSAKQFFLRALAVCALKARNENELRGMLGCRVSLLPHQLWTALKGIECSSRRVFLCDGVGLGKTIEAGLMLSALHARNKLSSVLVVAPEPLKVQWLTECFRRFNIRFRLEHEDLIEDDEHRDFIITSDPGVLDKGFRFDLVIVDEFHSAFNAVGFEQRWGQVLARADRLILLSATPNLCDSKVQQTLHKIFADSSEVPVLFSTTREEVGFVSNRKLQTEFVDSKYKWLIKFLANQWQKNPRRKFFIVQQQPAQTVELWESLRKDFGEKFALFHEDLTLIERDKYAAYFADEDGAWALVSSEIGGEGRNFQFCSDIVFMDIPDSEGLVEQRIGRLDRIGQSRKVNVWVPVIPETQEETLFYKFRDAEVFEKGLSSRGAFALDIKVFQQHFETLEAGKIIKEAKNLESHSVTHLYSAICEAFGVEVEDYDSAGNLKISSSSLMFVDEFPGLQNTGERIVTFNRNWALEREEFTFLSLDHPDVVSALELFLATENGKVSLGRSPYEGRAFVIGLNCSSGNGRGFDLYENRKGNWVVSNQFPDLNFNQDLNLEKLSEFFVTVDQKNKTDALRHLRDFLSTCPDHGIYGALMVLI